MFELCDGTLVNLAQALYVVKSANKDYPWKIVFERTGDIYIIEEDYNKIKSFIKIQYDLINEASKAIS